MYKQKQEHSAAAKCPYGTISTCVEMNLCSHDCERKKLCFMMVKKKIYNIDKCRVALL